MANALTVTAEQTEFTPVQKQALQALGMGAAQPGELLVFLRTCQKTGLDPFRKQIYLVTQRDETSPTGYKSTIQVDLNGLLTIARRTVMETGEAFSIAPILWCGTDGEWYDVWPDPQWYPTGAKACVKRGEETFTEVALFREFAPFKDGRLTGLWDKMPSHMIGKVALAHALRSAFPVELSGFYTDDEMAQEGPAVGVIGEWAEAPQVSVGEEALD